MVKDAKKFVYLMKQYGPGFVAISKNSGRVLAHGKDIKEMWEQAEERGVNLSNVTIAHVPRYGTVNIY